MLTPRELEIGVIPVDGMKAGNAQGPIVVFDAMCVLCSANAQFILKHDRKRHFRLASMQNEVGASLYRRFGIDPADPESIIVVDGEKLYRDSDAVIAIYYGLGGFWRLIGLGRLVPHFIRDPLYRWVARNRYRLFGRRESCWIPSREQADRIL
jgi:predicted DCC family thiol-disulfide oxidoreductase YuxK